MRLDYLSNFVASYVHNIMYFLISYSFKAISMHGDKSQQERDAVLAEFRSSKTPILVATDVAARGLGTFIHSILLCV